MFTGIITAIGIVRNIETMAGVQHLVIESPYDATSIAIGASIAHDGCCLTIVERGIVERGDANGGAWHSVDVSSHTLTHTTLESWYVGRHMNLERALRVGDELGGHIVSGHVDGLATIHGITHEGESVHYEMEAPESLACYIADKGSVTLDGTSLTVTWARGNHFGLTLIPHTLNVTTWGQKQVGDTLNLEIDMLARYMKRMLECIAL